MKNPCAHDGCRRNVKYGSKSGLCREHYLASLPKRRCLTCDATILKHNISGFCKHHRGNSAKRCICCGKKIQRNGVTGKCATCLYPVNLVPVDRRDDYLRMASKLKDHHTLQVELEAERQSHAFAVYQLRGIMQKRIDDVRERAERAEARERSWKYDAEILQAKLAQSERATIERCAKVCKLKAEVESAMSTDATAIGNHAAALTRARQAQTAEELEQAIRALAPQTPADVESAQGEKAMTDETLEQRALRIWDEVFPQRFIFTESRLIEFTRHFAAEQEPVAWIASHEKGNTLHFAKSDGWVVLPVLENYDRIAVPAKDKPQS